jgi:hypothetical protein
VLFCILFLVLFLSLAFWCVWRLLCLPGLRLEFQLEAAGLATHLESNQITDVMTSVTDWNLVDDAGAREERAGIPGRRRMRMPARPVTGADEEDGSTAANYRARDWAVGTRNTICPRGHSCCIHSRRIWSK